MTHNCPSRFATWLEGPRLLQSWPEPPVAVVTDASWPSAKSLTIEVSGQEGVSVKPGEALVIAESVFFNATAVEPFTCMAWASSDVLVMGGSNALQVWCGLHQISQPRLLYSLILHTSSPLVSLRVLPRSGVPNVRHGVCVAVHADGHVRLHSLPIQASPQGLVLKQAAPAPCTEALASPAVCASICSHPQHPGRLCVGLADGTLRFLDLPEVPVEQLPPLRGEGGAGFALMACGFLPGTDFSFWAVGNSSTVSIGDVREPFGGPGAPPPSQAGHAQTEFMLRTGDSSPAFGALVAGGDSGHVWVLPFSTGDPHMQPRLLCSLNGASKTTSSHLFLPVALVGSGSGVARALWLPTTTYSPQHLIHAASLGTDGTGSIMVDAPRDLLASVFSHAGALSVAASAWAPDLEARYAIGLSNGLVRVGNVKDFVVRYSGKL